MTIETALTYSQDVNGYLHRAVDGTFASVGEIQAWKAAMTEMAQTLRVALIVQGCKLGLVWAQMEACKALAYATTSPLYTPLANPETGEEEQVPYGETSTFVPYLPSSWVGAIVWDTTDLHPEIGTITVYGKAGDVIYRREGRSLSTLLSILRADVIAKSTGQRSIGATVLHYFGRKAQQKKSGVAAAYDPFVRNMVVNGQLLTTAL